MGTRGALAFVIAGEEKVTYNHWDSYPDGLGADVLEWLRGALSNEDPMREANLREAVAALSPVPDRPPTHEEYDRLIKFSNPSVGGRDEKDAWYRLLRETQGDPAKILAAGLYEPKPDFPLDSLFCEWAYVVDFDFRTFEVYQGFRQSPPTRGRWVGKQSTEDYSAVSREYYPVQRVRVWGFDRLPTTEALKELL